MVVERSERRTNSITQRGRLLAVLLAAFAWMPGFGFHNYGMMLGVPPFIEDVETLSRDAKELFRDGIIDSVALSCPIVPRGDPPTNKADAFAEMFRALRKRLEGILRGQALWWPLTNPML